MAVFLKVLSFILWLFIMLAVIRAYRSTPKKRKASRVKSSARDVVQVEQGDGSRHARHGDGSFACN